MRTLKPNKSHSSFFYNAWPLIGWITAIIAYVIIMMMLNDIRIYNFGG